MALTRGSMLSFPAQDMTQAYPAPFPMGTVGPSPSCSQSSLPPCCPPRQMANDSMGQRESDVVILPNTSAHSLQVLTTSYQNYIKTPHQNCIYACGSSAKNALNVLSITYQSYIRIKINGEIKPRKKILMTIGKRQQSPRNN